MTQPSYGSRSISPAPSRSTQPNTRRSPSRPLNNNSNPPSHQNDDAQLTPPPATTPQSLVSDPVPVTIEPSPPFQRFQLLAIVRRVNGVMSAQVRDNLKGTTKEVFEYEKLDDHILSKIDIEAKELTFLDTDMRSVIVKNQDASKVENHDK